MNLDTITGSSTKQPQLVSSPTTFRLQSLRGRGFAILAGLLIVAFCKPLWDLLQFCRGSDLYSHIILIPFISLYLIWLKKGELVLESKPRRGWAAIPLTIGTGMLILYWSLLRQVWRPPIDDYLAFMMGALLCLVWGSGFACLGLDTMLRLAFPFAFLAFAIPFPASFVDRVEGFLQHGSADVAHGLFLLVGTPVLRQGTFFQLPGFSLQVAPECSGIHSSLVLVISSFLGGYVLLQTGWRRVALALVVVPLAFLRNGFRIFLIGELCVNMSPDMINSYIHRRGGPIFFVLSLIPFFLLLFFLRRSEPKFQPTRSN